MKTLESDEKILEGKTVFNNGKVELDETGKRIEFLINNYLIKIKSDFSGWFVLYQDKKDCRYWELSYPNSEQEGGGSPVLKNIDINSKEIMDRYNLIQ